MDNKNLDGPTVINTIGTYGRGKRDLSNGRRKDESFARAYPLRDYTERKTQLQNHGSAETNKDSEEFLSSSER